MTCTWIAGQLNTISFARSVKHKVVHKAQKEKQKAIIIHNRTCEYAMTIFLLEEKLANRCISMNHDLTFPIQVLSVQWFQ